MSAFIAQGPPSRIIDEAINQSLSLILLEPTLVELERILTVKLGFSSVEASAVVELLNDISAGTQPSPELPVAAVSGDPDDDIVLACAVEAGVELLVSGDRRHLLPLGQHLGVRVTTPQALLAELRG